ncbi:MAG TPA: MBL fold metallo-hydrolase [Thermoanaerobaculia bacterium]|nr:MBL fold metallo-hydrolase [Thermoanaerobaculia bacterium]
MKRPYTKGLHDLGNGLWAYLQPDGGWGWSNAGLIVDGDRSLLVDTLFDLKLTREMLDAMRRATPAAQSIDTLVNTHANGDHCFGNELVSGARIVTSSASAKEMAEVGPARLAQLMRQATELGEAGDYLRRIFGAFQFDGITLTLPTETFDGETTLVVGGKEVRLYEVGPAHTQGDLLVHVPGDRAIFTGDILFIEGHPVIWAGPISNWIRACDRILAMDVETIVPGHGPLTDKNGVRRLRDYLEYIAREARRRYDAGMPMFEAAQDIALDDYSSWGDAERIVVNVNSLYREFSGSREPADVNALFAQMAALHKARRRTPRSAGTP